MKIDFERFAEDSIQKNTLRLSFWGTAVVWFLLLIFFAFAPGVQKKEEFKTIQITLDVPQCSSLDIGYSGFGTEYIETETHAKFPNARIVRIDRDSLTKKGELQEKIF